MGSAPSPSPARPARGFPASARAPSDPGLPGRRRRVHGDADDNAQLVLHVPVFRTDGPDDRDVPSARGGASAHSGRGRPLRMPGIVPVPIATRRRGSSDARRCGDPHTGVSRARCLRGPPGGHVRLVHHGGHVGTTGHFHHTGHVPSEGGGRSEAGLCRGPLGAGQTGSQPSGRRPPDRSHASAGARNPSARVAGKTKAPVDRPGPSSLERTTRLELATSTLARLRSTN